MKRINSQIVVTAVMFLIHSSTFAQGKAFTATSDGNVDALINRGSDTNYGNLQYASDGTLLWAIGLRGVNPADSLFFHDEDAGVSRMVIDGASGNVGIGLDLFEAPSYKLHVKGSVGAFTAQGPAITAESDGNVDVLINRGSSVNNGNLQYANDGTLLWAIGLRGVNQSESLFFYEEDAGESRMVIDGASGNVGIGLPLVDLPTFKLQVNGPVAAGNFVNLSSREAKTAIEPMNTSAADDILDRLLAMELTTYEYKDEYGGDGRRHLGFIAEDMPRELRSGDGRGIDLYALTSYAIGALQAQQRQIEGLSELRSTNNGLQAEISHLKAELAQLKQLLPGASSHGVVTEQKSR